MKKRKFEGKLKLNKEIVSKLQQDSMSKIKGGGTTMTTCPDPITIVPDTNLCYTDKSCATCQATMCNCTWATCG